MTAVNLKIRQRANRIIKSALNRGELQRPTECSKCGYEVPDNAVKWAGCFIKAHHDDYSKPLGIRWLCESCHKLYHNSLTTPDDNPGLSLREIGIVFNLSRQRVHAREKNKGRDEAIRAIHERRPELAYQEIADMFGLKSRQHAYHIIHKGK